MRRVIHTHNHYRLGDNIIQLNFLRKIVLCNDVDVIHYYNPVLCNGGELPPFIEGIEDRIKIVATTPPPGSLDSWRGPHWYEHPKRLNFCEYHLEWFTHLAEKMRVVNPIKEMGDLLLDYPMLYRTAPQYDVVVINSPALSGQFTKFSDAEFNYLIKMLVDKGHAVITTRPTEYCKAFEAVTVAHIGAVASTAKAVVGVSTGVSWPCFNVRNKNALHVMMLDYESVVLTERGRTVRTVYEAIQALQQENIL